MWFEFNSISLSSFDSLVIVNLSIVSMLICMVLSRFCFERVGGFLWVFPLKPNDFKVSCLVGWCWVLIGFIDFPFELIVLSKVNVLLIFFLLVYSVRGEMLEMIGCHLVISCCDWLLQVDELSILRFIDVDWDESLDLLLSLLIDIVVRVDIVPVLVEWWLIFVCLSLIVWLFNWLNGLNSCWFMFLLFIIFFHLFRNYSTFLFFFYIIFL